MSFHVIFIIPHDGVISINYIKQNNIIMQSCQFAKSVSESSLSLCLYSLINSGSSSSEECDSSGETSGLLATAEELKSEGHI